MHIQTRTSSPLINETMFNMILGHRLQNLADSLFQSEKCAIAYELPPHADET